MSDYGYVGHAIHIMETSSQKLIVSDFSQFEKWLKSTKPLSQSFKDDVMETYRIFSALIKHSEVFRKYAKLASVEWVFVAVFIHMHKNSSLAELADGIEAMFDHVREIHLGMDNRVQKDYVEFVGEWKKDTTKGDVQGTAGVGQKRKRTLATSKRKKRKLSADEDMNADDEEAEASNGDYEEEEPRPKKVSSQKPATQKAAPSAPISISDSKPSSPRVETEFDSISNALQNTPISSSNPPPVDRLAACRKVSKNQAAPALQTANPAGPRGTLPTQIESVNDNDKFVSIMRGNPQVLPSPAQGLVVPATVSESLSAIHHNLLLPPGSSTNSAVDVPLRKDQPNKTNNGISGGSLQDDLPKTHVDGGHGHRTLSVTPASNQTKNKFACIIG